MRQLAAYSLESEGGDEDLARRVGETVEAWLASKAEPGSTEKALILRSGVVASLTRSVVESKVGGLSEVVLTEPTAGGTFRTTFQMATSDGVVLVSITLEAASSEMTPISIDVHRPRLVRDLIGLASWSYRGTELLATPVSFDGAEGGDAFTSLVFDSERSVPVVAISDEYGAVLHPGIVEALADDLVGLAIVARLTPSASWRVTAAKTRDWSCFGGAIRLYWAGIDDSSSPYRHPLWTPRRLLSDGSDTETAALKIRSQIRRFIFSQAAFSVTLAPLFAEIRQAARREQFEALRRKAAEEDDYKSLAEQAFADLDRTESLIKEKDELIGSLKAKVASLTVAIQWQDKESGVTVAPNDELPPATVEEAVLMAIDQLAEDLEFGKACNQGIETLARDAGPPDKILSYLTTLAEMTRLKRQGSLGTHALRWLEEQGVIASPESDTIRNSPKEKSARTWPDGTGSSRFFETHLKPSDATSPDRVVRIYYEYDETTKKTIVGWIGRHP